MLDLYKKNEITLNEHEGLSQSAKDVLKHLHAGNTLRAYKSDFRDFSKYLDSIGKHPEDVTSTTIINYLDSLKEKGRKYSTIQRRLVAIRAIYKEYGQMMEQEAQAKGETDFVYHNPASTDRVKRWVKALRKTIGVAQKQKRPATKRIMNALLSEIQGDRLIDIRNRALLAIGYAGAFRRSELAALNVEDIEQDSEGVYIIVRKSKTDQEGQGMKKFIYYGEKASQCPVRLLEAWIRAAEIKEGALFRRVNKGGRVGDRMSDKAIYNVVKDTARKAGFDEREFGGHSLRAGLITQLADDGVEERDIMRHSGHKSVEIMRRYIREVDTKKKSPTKGIL
jgi:site-specific recombinase XerD